MIVGRRSPFDEEGEVKLIVFAFLGKRQFDYLYLDAFQTLTPKSRLLSEWEDTHSGSSVIRLDEIWHMGKKNLWVIISRVYLLFSDFRGKILLTVGEFFQALILLGEFS